MGMHWNIDPHTAAYGRFQLAFAALDTEITEALVALQRANDPRRAFRETKQRLRQFGRRLEKLELKVKQFGNNERTQFVLESCSSACEVSKWRNDRIHANVRFFLGQLVLVGDDGQALEITDKLCIEKADLAIEAVVQLQAHIPFLVSCLNVNDEIDGL